MVLQNWRALDPLTAGQGGTCIYLKEECCFYFNQSGQVSTSIQNILKPTEKMEHFGTGILIKNWQLWIWSLLLPLIVPLTFLFILLLLGLPFLNHLVQFVPSRIQAIYLQIVLQGRYHPLQSMDPIPYCGPLDRYRQLSSPTHRLTESKYRDLILYLHHFSAWGS